MRVYECVCVCVLKGLEPAGFDKIDDDCSSARVNISLVIRLVPFAACRRRCWYPTYTCVARLLIARCYSTFT